jgi:hypothetical protein
MIQIKLPSGEEATVNNGVWRVQANAELERVLNAPEMQPPPDSHYAPTDDARKAYWVLETWGGTWVSSDEHHPPGKLY